VFFFVQPTGGSTVWECALASERDRIVSELKPEFVTVLDVDNSFTQPLTAEEQQAVKYRAPYGFYTDFDGDLDEVLNQARVFLLKLEKEHGFDKSQARLWFTGGRGVHIEIPIECFVAKVPPAGIAMLPAIFKEMAMSTYVDTLDMRIFSAKKGRQWRVPNVKRDNGLYKVQVTLNEFMTASVEDYKSICSAPRAALPITPPTCNAKLSLLFTLAREKVDLALKRRKAKKTSNEHVQRFEGKWPDSFRLLLTGEGVRETVGWNQIAMQVASFGLALGKSEQEIIDDAKGLIDTHSGDSDRYGSPRKRERELRNQIRYQDENPGYEFSIGGIKSLFAKGAYAEDLDWSGVETAEADEDGEPDEGDEGDDSAEPLTDEEAEAERAALREAIKKATQETLERLAVTYSRQGVFMKTENGPVKVSSAGFAKPVRLGKLSDGSSIGYEVEVIVDGLSHGRRILPMASMTSKASFQSWLSTFGTSISAPDTVVPQLTDLFRIRTRGAIMITVSREGVDVITPPTTPESRTQRPTEIIFSSSDKVLSLNGTQLRFRGMNDPDGAFKSDLWSSPSLEDTDETREFFDNLWEINDRVTLGKMVGWFTACFMCQPIREAYKQFPIMQVWGQAGSGKSKTTELFNHMHYWRHDPKKLSATGSTFFPIMAAVTQSASIPVLFDEYKPREMSKHNKDLLSNIFRNNYEGGQIERGSLTKDAGNKEVVINSYSNVAPVGFIGEAIESQTAILERSVSVPFSKASRAGRGKHFAYVFARRRAGPLSQLGKSLAQAVMSSDVRSIAATVEHYQEQLRTRVGDAVSDDIERPIFNLSVVLAGHDLLKQVLSSVFGDRYDDKVDAMKEALLGTVGHLVVMTMSEAAKVLDVMAQLSRERDIQYKLEKNVEFYTDEVNVDIKLKLAFAKYVRYRKSLGMEVLFDNEDAFIAGMRSYAGVVSLDCMDSPIRKTPFEKIFRFSCAHMSKEGIESFFDM